MTESFQDLFEESLKTVEMNPGAIITGVVIDIDKDWVTVHAGLKSEGVISLDQFYNDKGEIEVVIGDEVQVALEAVEDGFGATKLSREKARRAESWIELEAAHKADEVVIGVISGKVKGGFTVDVRGLRAFLPGSLVDVRPRREITHLENIDLDKVFAAFKDVADRKDEVDDRDLMAIISEHTSFDVDELWKLDLVQVSTTDHGRPTATVRLIDSSDEVFEDAAVGEGPVDAIYNAVNRVTGAENTLTEYSVKSVTEGINAQGEVTIRIESNGNSYMGRAADPDILVASTRAYIHAMNRSLNDDMAS